MGSNNSYRSPRTSICMALRTTLKCRRDKRRLVCQTYNTVLLPPRSGLKNAGDGAGSDRNRNLQKHTNSARRYCNSFFVSMELLVPKAHLPACLNPTGAVSPAPLALRFSRHNPQHTLIAQTASDASLIQVLEERQNIFPGRP